MAEDFVDVPSPIDLRTREHAQTWADEALAKRPQRPRFFASFAQAITPGAKVLELGSGPGFLAEHLLAHVPGIALTLLDFSPAMHELAQKRAPGARFLLADFLRDDWSAHLGTFDFVITMQAVHELRHKRRAAKLHAQVRTLLVEGGAYLVCDHYVGTDGMKNDQLFMTLDEQRAALASAGFTSIDTLRSEQGLALHQARF